MYEEDENTGGLKSRYLEEVQFILQEEKELGNTQNS